jgi:predicted transcriptional regulator
MASVLLKLEIKLAGKSGNLGSFMAALETAPKPKKGEIFAQAFVNSEDEFNSVYTSTNRELLAWIRANEPESVYEMAKDLGKDASNLTKTLRALAKFSLVRLEEGNAARKTLRPFVDWEQLEVRFPAPELKRKAG